MKGEKILLVIGILAMLKMIVDEASNNSPDHFKIIAAILAMILCAIAFGLSGMPEPKPKPEIKQK